nr:hypothetical protein [Tanacetum cinerariifolium]
MSNHFGVLVKENSKKDKIESKPNKNRKRGEAEKSQKQLQWIEEEKLNKMQKEGPKMQTHAKSIKALKKERRIFALSEDSDFKDSIDQSDLTNYDDLFVDPTPEMFTDEQPTDYSFPPRFDVYPDDFLEIESDNTFDDDLFDSEGEKIKEAELLIDQLDLLCDIHFEYDSFNSQDFSKDDDFPSPDNEDEVKENSKKNKIGSKPDKNEKRGEAGKSQKQLQWIEEEKLNKMQKEGPKMQIHAKSIKALKKER